MFLISLWSASNPMSFYDRTPGWVYWVALILAIPATWVLVGTSGENVPGIVAMITSLICWIVISAALAALRRRILQNRATRDC